MGWGWLKRSHAKGSSKPSEKANQGTKDKVDGDNLPSETTHLSYPGLKEQLSKKSRHFSVIPGSFFERFEQYSPRNTTRRVEPRTEGSVQYRHGPFSQWKSAYCRLEDGYLIFYEESAAGDNGSRIGRRPVLKAHLVGAHLRGGGDRNPACFSLDGAETGKSTLHIRSRTSSERDQWLVALGRIPGLLRRATDYYLLGKRWGTGATSQVQEAVGRFTGKRLALKKRLKVSRESTEAMHNELRILQICAKHEPHPAIPQLEDFFFDTDGRIELILELMEGGELFDWIAEKDHLTEEEAKAVFAQIASGVAYLHSLGIAHRDLKPQNLMCTMPPNQSGNIPIIKIMDYDLAKVNYCPQWEGTTPCGTTHYMAPGKTDESVHRAINGGRFSMDDLVWETVSNEAKDLVCQLLKVNPEERITAEQCLQHPWLAFETSNDVLSVYERVATDVQIGMTSHAVEHASEEKEQVKRSVRDEKKTSSSRKLKTVENLRLKGDSQRNSVPYYPYGGGSLRNLANNVAAVIAASPKQERSVTQSPVSLALEYSLDPIRAKEERLASDPILRKKAVNGGKELNGRDACSADISDVVAGNGQSHRQQDAEKDLKLSQLRVSLDLIGTAGGILDSRAAQAHPADLGEQYASAMTPNSPVTSFRKQKNLDYFEDMDLTQVEDEHDIPNTVGSCS